MRNRISIGVAVAAAILTAGCVGGWFRNAEVAAWEASGRAETLRWFSENQFGVTPAGRLPDEKIGENSVSFAGGAIRIDIHVSLPAGASAEHPAPVFLFGDHVGGTEAAPPFATDGVYAGIPTNAITARGYAYVTWNFNSVCPNVSRGRKNLAAWDHGIIAYLASGDKAGRAVRTPSSWGTIGAWAWGNSRMMDWIETRPDLDARRVAVLGHSRGGKTALWTGAQDTRFALTISNGSGCGGAKLNKMDLPQSEHIERINYTFPNWFCLNYRRWNNQDAAIAHDSDDLLKLIAPRLLYVASGSADAWAGPAGEAAATESARTLWAAYGCPARVGYHCHEGPHRLTPFDWERFMDFADKHMR